MEMSERKFELAISGVGAITTFLCIAILVHYHSQIGNKFMAELFFSGGLFGVTVCSIQYALGKWSAREVVSKLFLTCGFFVLCVGWLLR